MKIADYTEQPIDISGKIALTAQGQVIQAGEGTKVTVLDLLDMRRRALVGMQQLKAAYDSVDTILSTCEVEISGQDNG